MRIRGRLQSFVLMLISILLSLSGAELIARVYNPKESQTFPSTPFRAEFHPLVGYTNTRSTAYDAEVEVSGHTCYRVRYTFDSFGRRIVPEPEAVEHPELELLLIGDSFSFGSGVSDTENLQYFLGSYARTKNYGVFGYGPQHVLALLNSELVETPTHSSVIAIWTLIPDQLARLNAYYSQPFWEESPVFEQVAGGLENVGKVKNVNPLKYILQERLRNSALMKLVLRSLTVMFQSTNAAQMGEIVLSGRKILKEKYGANLLVVLHPAWNPIKSSSAFEVLKNKLKEGAINSLDLSEMPYCPAQQIGEGCDRHPNGESYREVSEKIRFNLERQLYNNF